MYIGPLLLAVAGTAKIGPRVLMDWFYYVSILQQGTRVLLFLAMIFQKNKKQKKNWNPKETKRVRGGKLIYI